MHGLVPQPLVQVDPEAAVEDMVAGAADLRGAQRQGEHQEQERDLHFRSQR
jgi:hypothetical protein